MDQFARVTASKRPAAAELLRGFERRHLLGSFGNVGLRGHGKTPKVYYLTRRSYELLRRESGIPDELLEAYREVHVEAKWSPQMYHRLFLVDLLIALEVGVRERPHLTLVETFLEYRRVKRGSRIMCETTDFVANEETSANRIIPDAAFVLENVETGSRGLFLLEMDMGTERIVSQITQSKHLTLRYKMEQYDRYLVGGRFAQRYKPWGEFRFFTLLFVTTSDTRVENIRKEMFDLPEELHKYYRFNTYARVKKDFFNEEWKARSSRDERGYKIIR